MNSVKLPLVTTRISPATPSIFFFDDASAIRIGPRIEANMGWVLVKRAPLIAVESFIP